MSVRSELAQRMSDFLAENDLLQVYASGEVNQSKTYYSISFCKARVLDGTVKVYSPKFIQIKFMTQYRILPATDSMVFESEENAKEFLRRAFVEISETAYDVPHRKG